MLNLNNQAVPVSTVSGAANGGRPNSIPGSQTSAPSSAAQTAEYR